MGGIIYFHQLDQEWYGNLCSFRDLIVQHYGDLHNCMDKLDGNHNNMIEIDEVEEVCKTIGYTMSSPTALFQQLRRDKARRFITMEDIQCQGVMTWAATRFEDKRPGSPGSPSNSNSPKNNQRRTSLKDTRYFG